MNFKSYNEDEKTLKARIGQISNTSMLFSEKIAIFKKILSCIDLTTLNGNDTHEKIGNLCKQALAFEDKQLGIPTTAAVCIYPVFAKIASETLMGTKVKTDCVAGAFPSGQSPLEVRIQEVEYALKNGAQEIDMVISRGRMIESDEDFIFKEVNRIKETCGNVHLKVILETGELKEVSLIRRASEIALLAGADFLKTSTGKIQPAATPEAFLIMLDTIKEYYVETGNKIGIKPAGGISEPEDALLYYKLTRAILGEEWLNNKLFRIGASRLATKVNDYIINNSTV